MTDDDGEGLGLGEPRAPLIERGAAIEGDEDAIAEAADTSLDMDGFETGAGFDLENSPDKLGADVDTDAVELKSDSFDEIDLGIPDMAGSADVGGADPVADVSEPPTVESTPEVSTDLPTLEGLPDLPTVEGLPGLPPAEGLPGPSTVEGLLGLTSDEGLSGLPSATSEEELPGLEVSDEPEKKVKLSGLKRLERQKMWFAVRRVVTAVLIILLVVGGAGLVLGYLGVVQIPGITPLDRSRSAVAAPVVLPGPQPETPVMSHVVFVDEWREAETPLAWADALRERMPDLLGFVTTLSIDGDRRYALVVGPAYSVEEANGLKVPLEAAFTLLNPDPESWTVRDAPYSFFFGEYEGSAGANARVQELADLSVPAFVLKVTYPAGASALRVYSGAFSDEFEAGEMGKLLSENRLDDTPLIERQGLLPD